MAKKPLARSYRDKRDPGRTNEPFPPEPMARSKAAGTRAGSFVVHLHDATRRHFDLRIELGGALKSFAVPKGPSLDPQQKRLAVQTEDHPLEYLDFEAVIPEGNYGAGAMILWDRGGVRYLDQSAEEGLAHGKIDFTLHGFKLRGRFALVKTSGRKGEREPKQPQWLLIKKSDAGARPGGSVVDEHPESVLSGLTVEQLERAPELARELEAEARALGAQPLSRKAAPLHWTPMLCADRDGQLDRRGFIYELKLDGVRILAHRSGRDVNLRYRTGRSATDSYPEVARAVRALYAERCVLDGEIVAFDEHGRPDFERLGRRIHATRTPEARSAAREVPVTYVVFDLLLLGALDLRPLPLLQRKQLLARLCPGRGIVRTLDHLEHDGRPLMAFCQEQGLEGVIAKRADSRYVVGPRRSGDWIKIKRQRDDDFVVIGYTRGSGARARLGSLELASYSGPSLSYRGRVGSGLDEAAVDHLLRLLSARELREGDAAPVSEPLPDAPRGRRLVRPELVVNVRHAGFTSAGHLRHPVYRGLRPDKAPRDCTAGPSDERVEQALVEADAAHADTRQARRGRVQLTNQGKVFWPDEGYTKGDLCRYYDAIADTLLPYLRNRPVLMVRYPDGISGKSFYQWSVPAGTPDWVRTFPVRSDEHDGREVTSFLVRDRDTLLYIANLGSIPLHILASHADDLEVCDFLTIDFDLGEAPFRDAVVLARTLRELLTDLGLAGFPKTSGQTGLHVLVPLGGAPFATAKTLAELLGRILQLRHPEIGTVERMRRNRPNAVYIDTGQTGRSRAIVAPYSVRATPGARVSTPLSWDEVGFGLDPGAFTMFTVPERVARHGDPMAAMLAEHPDLPAAIEALGKLLKH